MVITNKIKIDLLERGSTIVVYAVQSDKYSRSIDFSLYEGGVKWIPSPSTTAVVAYKKPDGTGGEYDTLPNGETAYSFSENDVTVALAPQVLTVPGRVILSVGLLEGESILYSFPVEICVIQNPGIVTHSENYFKILGALADSGWEPNMFLCTDENGNVVSVPAPSGVKGEKGDPGEDGGYYIPQITEPTAGVIRFAFNGTKATMQPIIPSDFNLPRGEQGVQGEKGEPGEKGEAED